MKVGMIGLGRRGEGMSRRMLKADIEVWGYSKDYAKSSEQYDTGYVSGVTTSLEILVDRVKNDSNKHIRVGKVPGIFQLAIPEEKVDDTLDELLPLLEEGDIIIDYSSDNVEKCIELEKYCSKLGVSYLFGGVYGATYAVATCQKIFESLSA
jgi:6-phosphogluconate dehydrogenase